MWVIQTDQSDPSLDTGKQTKETIWVFCRKGDPKEQQDSRLYLIWAISQILMSRSSCLAFGAAPWNRNYESLNDADVQERMSTSMLLIKMRGTGCTDISRKSRQSYMSISISYSFYCGF